MIQSRLHSLEGFSQIIGLIFLKLRRIQEPPAVEIQKQYGGEVIWQNWSTNKLASNMLVQWLYLEWIAICRLVPFLEHLRYPHPSHCHSPSVSCVSWPLV